MTQPVFGFIPAAPFVAPALPVAVPAVTGAAVAGVGLAASLPVAVAVGVGLAGGFLLGAALAQLWGRVAGPRRSTSVSLSDKTTFQVTTTSQKVFTWRYGYKNYEKQTRCDNGATSVYNGGSDTSAVYSRQCYGIRVVSPGTGYYASGCGVSEFVAKYGYFQIFDGVSWYGEVGGWGGSRNKTGDVSVVYEWKTWIAELTIDGVPYVPQGVPNDWIGAGSVNDFVELPEAGSLFAEGLPPAPLPLPAAFVPSPVGDPLTEQDNSTAPRPMLPPLVSPRPWPAAAPSARPVLNDGTLAPLAPALPASVPADVHYPVPGGAPVGGLAQAPQATLAGIAAEVGRIESKLNRMLNPTPVGDSSDLMQLLWQAIQALYNSMTDNRPAGAYLLSSPCELDANGDRILSSVTWPATEDNTAAVLARIDAIAALLQTHKDLKQPNCKPPAATGQPVQVQFTQI